MADGVNRATTESQLSEQGRQVWEAAWGKDAEWMQMPNPDAYYAASKVESAFHLWCHENLPALLDRIEELEKALCQHGHVADIREDRFSLEHPVECRKLGLLDCPLDKALEALPGPPMPFGRYPVELQDDGSLTFGEAIVSTTSRSSGVR